MAATPEDPEPPFSPSVFLNLPPTPDLDGDGAAAPTPKDDDDLVGALPFVSRMLMEEEDDEESLLQQYPDGHTALLQVQKPFADILYEAEASSTKSSSGSAAPAAFATCCWPYDPADLSRRLLSTDSLASSGDANKPAENADTMSIPPPPPAAGAGFLDVQNKQDTSSSRAVVDMEMLNLAFLKGMEEANKFLPSNNNSKMFQQESTSNTKGGNGKQSTQRQSWDDFEAEMVATRSSSKLIALEPEEAGETVHGIIQDGYQSLIHALECMTIARTHDDGGGDASRSKGKRGSNEAVDLRTLLIHCAQAVATGNRLSATDLLRQIKRRSSPTGDATQRLAHWFSTGLEARLAGTGARSLSLSPSVSAFTRTSLADLLMAYQLYMAACCFDLMAFKFSNMVICKAIAERTTKKVHVVDYGEHFGFQWPPLLSFWGRQEGGPPELRITAVALPQPGFRPAARVEQIGCCLAALARQRGVPFRFRAVVSARWETVRAEDLDIHPDEVLVVNGLFHLGKLMDEAGAGADDEDVDSPSPRDMVLANIGRMRPDVFVLCVDNSSCGAPYFVGRFREALFYYAAMFDMMDATTAPRDSAKRALVEQELLGRRAVNAIACEGPERVERPEAYRQWQVRCGRAGLKQTPLPSDIVSAVTKKVNDRYHKDFFVDVDDQWLLQGWKGRALCAMSTWVANHNHDATSFSSSS